MNCQLHVNAICFLRAGFQPQLGLEIVRDSQYTHFHFLSEAYQKSVHNEYLLTVKSTTLKQVITLVG